MNLRRHFVRCFFAGIVALLPVGGTVLSIVYLESVLAASWLADQAFYFPGLGLLAAGVTVYLIGLCVTTFIGRWLWKRVDGLIDRLPALGQLYQTLKQILGYGEGEEALFERVVLVPSKETDGVQVGLLTARQDDGKFAVFLPGSPNPTTGRLVYVEESSVQPVETSVANALRSLLSVGKSDLVPQFGK